MAFKYTENTQIEIDGKKHYIAMYDGMSGIGSRTYWLDNEKQLHDIVTHSEDITKGNHYLYTIKYGECPWEVVDILIDSKLETDLLNEESSWREPVKREL
jgi:hypothetical protein